MEDDSLQPELEDFPVYDNHFDSQEDPVDVNDPRPISQAALEQQQQPPPLGRISDKVDTFDDGMLLARPNLSFRTQEPGRDFNYGPATAISAANFTKSSHRVAPIQQYKDGAEVKKPVQKSQPIVPSNNTNRSPLAETAEPVVEKQQGKKSDGPAPLAELKKPFSPPLITHHQVDDVIDATPKRRKDTMVSTTSHPIQDPFHVPSVPTSVRSRAAEVSISHPRQFHDCPGLSRHYKQEINASKSLSSTSDHPQETRKQHSRQGSGRIMAPPFAEEEQDGYGTSRPHEPEVEKSVPGLRASRHAPSSVASSSRQKPIHHTTHARGPIKSVDISRHSKTIVVNHGHRPPSRSSNVSRRRAVPPKSHVSHIPELPSELCSESVAPSPDARQNTLAIDHDFTSNMANVINKYTQHHKSAIDRQMAKYEKYIKRLKFEREQGKKELEKCTSQIEAQAHTIQELQDREALMADHIKSHENESAAAEARTQKIEEKYHMIKGFLNSAIEEQQNLYSKAKKQCENSVVEIRAMEESHKSSMEAAVKKAETARVKMLEKVKQIIADANMEEQGLRKQINSAHQQLEQKTAELERQQNENRLLSERLQSVKSETNGLESLVAQNKEILEKLDEQHTATSKKTKEVEAETQAKFDELTQEIKTLLKQLAGQPLELINIQNSNKELADCITTKANEMAWCQSVTEETTGKFFTDIETLVKQVLKHLNQQNQDTSQDLNRVTEECGGLSLLVKVGEARCQELEAEIDAMKEDADKREKEIQELDEKLFHCQSTEMELMGAQQQVLSAQMDKQRLEDEVQSKVTTIQRLEEMLREKNEAYTLELSKFTTNLTKLNQMLRDKEESSRVATATATELARSEMRIEMEKAGAEAMKALHLVGKERDAVAADVEILKRDLRVSEDKSVHDAQVIESLSSTLAATESRLVNLADEVKQRTTDLEELRAQETATIKALEDRISSVETTTAGRLGETRHLLTAIQEFVVALRNWSEWGPFPGEVKRILVDFEISPSSGEESNARFSEIIEKITAVIRTQKPPAPEPEMILQDDSSSRFFSLDNNILPDLRSSDQHGTGAEETMSLRPRAQQPAVFGNRLNDQSMGRVQSLMHDQRRVEVRSPALDLQDEPSPPSVQQEKAKRREAQQPRPIIKRGPQCDDRGVPMAVDEETSDGVFTRRVDEVLPQGPVSSTQQQGPEIPNGQQEPGKSDGNQKGKKATGRAAPRSRSKAPPKSHESTVPSKRKNSSGETGNKPIRIRKSALIEESQRSLSSQDLPAGNGFGPRHPVEHGLSPPDSHKFFQASWAGRLASQSQGLTRTGRTYGTRNNQKDSLMTGQSQGHSQPQLGNSQSQLGIWEVEDDDDALAATQDRRQKRARTGSQGTDSQVSGPALTFPNLGPAVKTR